MADVRLTDLEIIQRYSIAVRGETADREELAAALRADLNWLEGGARARRTAVSDDDSDTATDEPRRAAIRSAPRAPARPSPKPAARKASTPKPAARKASTPKPAARKAPTPKPAARKASTPKPAARRAVAPAKRATKKTTKPAARRGR